MTTYKVLTSGCSHCFSLNNKSCCVLTLLHYCVTGPLLSFDVNDSTAFEVPLANVSQCATGKNEVTLEFHQNDDAEVSLMEVRFYVPPSQADERQDPVEVGEDVLII